MYSDDADIHDNDVRFNDIDRAISTSADGTIHVDNLGDPCVVMDGGPMVDVGG